MTEYFPFENGPKTEHSWILLLTFDLIDFGLLLSDYLLPREADLEPALEPDREPGRLFALPIAFSPTSNLKILA